MIKKAIEQAKKSVDFKHRLGAVITDKRNNVLSSGFNIKKTHPMQAKYSRSNEHCYLHAEIAALVRCRGEAYNIYVARVSKQNKLRLAKPCKYCMAAILESDIKNIYFTNNKGKVERLGL